MGLLWRGGEACPACQVGRNRSRTGLLLRGPLGCMHFQWSGVWEVGGARAPGSPYLQAGPVPTIQTTCAGENGPCPLSSHRAKPYGIRVGLSLLLPKGICGLGNACEQKQT